MRSWLSEDERGSTQIDKDIPRRSEVKWAAPPQLRHDEAGREIEHAGLRDWSTAKNSRPVTRRAIAFAYLLVVLVVCSRARPRGSQRHGHTSKCVRAEDGRRVRPAARRSAAQGSAEQQRPGQRRQGRPRSGQGASGIVTANLCSAGAAREEGARR
ncbi:hypothetical protein B0J12DRAFT_192090 [Macrophomina phaseolina]|uniref:Uncharacterized protein n=1 Tax=Macrophomina phaseolina TaxID=35725 RepID=A0ABQ8G3K4_9PEZI|nr:hypothetical protein B0J12DRAFT_192090 [Macrophomina phaseolina]